MKKSLSKHTFNYQQEERRSYKFNMVFKVATILALFVAYATAAKYDLNFVEKGDAYTEKIEINKQEKTVKYVVPAHAGVQYGEYLTDYTMRLSIMKLDSMKKCYAMALPDDEPNPDELEAGVRKVNGQFPHSKYWAENLDILPVAEIDPTTLTKAIKDFCGAYEVIQVLQAEEKTMESVALTAAKAYQNGRSKRRVVTEFITCDKGNELTIANCDPKKLITKCKFVAAKTCVYRVACKISNTGWDCPGVHKWHILHCCNYTCS